MGRNKGVPEMVYTPEMEKFIFDNYEKYPDLKLTEEFNKKFECNLTKHQIRHFRRKHKLNGKKHQFHSEVFTDEIREFIQKNYKGTGYQEMVRLIWREFEVAYTAKQIRSYYRNHKLNSGLAGSLFKKGEVNYPMKKGTYIPGCEKSWFRKGQKPYNHVPIGTERLRANGYVWVKIAEPKKWRMKHLVVWESANGPIPDGYKIYFRDGNPQNCELDNLMLIENRIRGILNRSGLCQHKGELVDTAVNVARLKLAISDAKKEVKNETVKHN